MLNHNQEYMTKRIIFILLLTSIGQLISFAQEQDLKINTQYREILKISNPLLYSSNPASISYNRLDSISKISLSYTNKKGTFSPIMIAKNSNLLSLRTETLKKVNKTMLYGAFRYAKTWENDLHYTNLYDTYRGTPYLFIDTIKSANSEREEYQIDCKLSHHFNQYITLAGALDYTVGLSAQNKDPRALNKLIKIKNKIGLIADGEIIKIGVDAFYNYFNEDIEIRTIRNNTTFDLYATTGLGTSNKHNSATFYRLYKGYTYGYDLQIDLFKNLIELGLEQYQEKTFDGRNNNIANWSTVKIDSYYKTRTWHIKDIYTINKTLKNHQFIFGIEQLSAIGREVLQELQQINEGFDIYQWTTLLEEDKYQKIQNKVNFTYTYSKFKSTFLRDYSIGTSVHYFEQEEAYNFKDLSADFSNINFNLNGSKHYQVGQHSLEARVDIDYKNNIKSSQNLDFSTNITELIIKHDLKYLTSNLIGGSLEFNYSYTTLLNRHYFITGKYDLQHTENSYFNKKERHYTSLSLGLMF